MRKEKLQKIVLYFCICIAFLLVADFNIFTLLYFKFSSQEFIRSSFYKVWFWQPEISASIEGLEVEDTVEPIVNVASNNLTVLQEDVKLIAFSSELLEEGDYEKYSLERDKKFTEEDFYLYTVNLKGIRTKEGDYELVFRDMGGNSTRKKVNLNINSGLILGASTEEKEKILPLDDNLLEPVDREYALPSNYIPGDLEKISSFGIPTRSESIELRIIVISQLKNLIENAEADGFHLVVNSGYRSFEGQAILYNHLYLNHGALYVDETVANPGHSEHQLGTAVDLTNLDIMRGVIWDFRTTEDAKWLEKNAHEYGFILSYPKGAEEETGYGYEPWHYRYVGREIAAEIKESGELPQVYLRNLYFNQ